MENEKSLRIIWTPTARLGIEDAYEWIFKDSPQNAEMVIDDLLKLIGKIPEFPARHPLDRFKLENPGDHRAFEKHNYRVTYFHTDSVIVILRIRHVKQNPIWY